MKDLAKEPLAGTLIGKLQKQRDAYALQGVVR